MKGVVRTLVAFGLASIVSVAVLAQVPPGTRRPEQLASDAKELTAQRQYAKAVETALTAIRYFHWHWEPYVAAAEAYTGLGNFPEAIAMLQEAFVRGPEARRALIEDAITALRREVSTTANAVQNGSDESARQSAYEAVQRRLAPVARKSIAVIAKIDSRTQLIGLTFRDCTLKTRNYWYKRQDSRTNVGGGWFVDAPLGKLDLTRLSVHFVPGTRETNEYWSLELHSTGGAASFRNSFDQTPLMQAEVWFLTQADALSAASDIQVSAQVCSRSGIS